MRKINILQLVEGFSFGGAEGKLLELVERLDKSKYNELMEGYDEVNRMLFGMVMKPDRFILIPSDK